MSTFSPLSRKTMSLPGEKSSALELARSRLVVVGIAFAFAWLLVAVRAFDLSIIQGVIVRGQEEALAQPAGDPGKAVPVLRGDIVDRNGVLIATTLRTASLYADPGHVLEPERVARGLAAIFPSLSEDELFKKLTANRRFVWIARNLTPADQAKVLELGEPGLNFEDEPSRIYPQGPLAAHVAGYTDIDGKGLAGIERSFDRSRLSKGQTVRLSLDVRIQHFLRREMLGAVKTFAAKGGVGIVLDIATGEVLAAVSLPDFDPQDSAAASDEERFNRFTLGVYEPGSVFKIFSTAALLDSGDVSLSKRYDVREPLKEGRFTIRDFHPENRELTIPEVFMLSSNIGAAMMGEELGTEKLRRFYDRLGLLEAPRTEILEQGQPLVPYPWRDINTLTAAYGHGISVTPLQLATAVAEVAGGRRVNPTFLAAQSPLPAHGNGANGDEKPILKPQTVIRMRQLMRLVVTSGTGTMAEAPGYEVGGKTGTAEKIGAGGYDTRRLLSSFAGMFPANDPRYVVLVMIDEPKGNAQSHGYATGGWVAAPAVSRVIAAMAPLLGMAPAAAQPEDKPDPLVESLMKYVHTEQPQAHRQQEAQLVSY